MWDTVAGLIDVQPIREEEVAGFRLYCWQHTRDGDMGELKAVGGAGLRGY